MLLQVQTAPRPARRGARSVPPAGARQACRRPTGRKLWRGQTPSSYPTPWP